MQGLADGYFVLPNTINDYLAAGPFPKVDANHPAVVEAVAGGAEPDRQAAVDQRHAAPSTPSTRSSGHVMWDYCGMERSEEGLRKAHRPDPGAEGRSSGPTSRCWAPATELNQALERAGRVADFFELGELMCIDALVRRESCGGHFRVESQTEDGEALRDDDEFAYVSAWEFGGEGGKPVLHKEPLVYEYVEMKQRSYK